MRRPAHLGPTVDTARGARDRRDICVGRINFSDPLPLPPSARRPDSGAGRYVRSFLFERLVIGGLGIALPLVLVFLDWGLFQDNPVPRDSLSAYYYSGMREWFVLTIGTTGFFLIAYKITENNLDNTLSILGGACALLIPCGVRKLGLACKITGSPTGTEFMHPTRCAPPGRE
jgi:hypothetical protein